MSLIFLQRYYKESLSAPFGFFVILATQAKSPYLFLKQGSICCSPLCRPTLLQIGGNLIFIGKHPIATVNVALLEWLWCLCF